MSGRLEDFQELAHDILTDNADLLYTLETEFSDGTTCRYSVQDPARTSSGAQLAQRLTGLPDVLDVRLLRVHPDDTRPEVLASIPWDGGLLKIEEWTQVGKFTLQSIGVCRFTR